MSKTIVYICDYDGICKVFSSDPDTECTAVLVNEHLTVREKSRLKRLHQRIGNMAPYEIKFKGYEIGESG